MQYPLHISAAVVITDCAGFLFWWEVFNALNCTCGVFGRKLLLIDVSSEYKLICVGSCRKSVFHMCY